MEQEPRHFIGNKTSVMFTELDPETKESLKLKIEFTSEGLFRVSNKELGVEISGGIRKNGKDIGLIHLTIGDFPRGQKIGSKIMNDVEKMLKQKGISYIWAAFRKPKTINFLLNRGYEVSNPGLLDFKTKLEVGMSAVLLEEKVKDKETLDKWLDKSSGYDTGAKILLKKTI